jgi:hypothetical protein
MVTRDDARAFAQKAIDTLCSWMEVDAWWENIDETDAVEVIEEVTSAIYIEATHTKAVAEPEPIVPVQLPISMARALWNEIGVELNRMTENKPKAGKGGA